MSNSACRLHSNRLLLLFLLHIILLVYIIYIISNLFFENQPNEICSYLSEKASKGRFLKPGKLQIHSDKGKGKEKMKERGEGKEKMKERGEGKEKRRKKEE